MENYRFMKLNLMHLSQFLPQTCNLTKSSKNPTIAYRFVMPFLENVFPTPPPNFSPDRETSHNPTEAPASCDFPRPRSQGRPDRALHLRGRIHHGLGWGSSASLARGEALARTHPWGPRLVKIQVSRAEGLLCQRGGGEERSPLHTHTTIHARESWCRGGSLLLAH